MTLHPPHLLTFDIIHCLLSTTCLSLAAYWPLPIAYIYLSLPHLFFFFISISTTTNLQYQQYYLINTIWSIYNTELKITSKASSLLCFWHSTDRDIAPNHFNFNDLNFNSTIILHFNSNYDYLPINLISMNSLTFAFRNTNPSNSSNSSNSTINRRHKGERWIRDS